MITIVLIVATIGSIMTLFLRGFNIKDYTNQLNSKILVMPEAEVWLLEKTGFNDKIDAYQAGIATAEAGCGIYVIPQNNQWTCIAGVYTSKDEANNVLKQIGTNIGMEIKPHRISSRRIKILSEAFDTCQNVLKIVQNVFDLLLKIRKNINQSTNEINNLRLELIAQYNQIKSNVEILQKLNANLHDQIIATVIYTANQNILSLQEIISSDKTQPIKLTTINTALLKTIFSLDNF